MDNIKSILITGGCGFIGCNFIHMILKKNPEIHIVNLDALTYAGNLENLNDVMSHPQYHFIRGNICNEKLVKAIIKKFKVQGIINFAAESHVDRSITGSKVFINTNIMGTGVLINVALHAGIRRFLQISTDEVYGSLGASGTFSESSPIKPNSPYSATKAGADLLVLAFHHTHNLDVVVTRCSNNYGPYQFPEKLIPLMFNNARKDKPLPVYGDGLNVRDWIYVDDHCRAVWLAFMNGKSGEIYNIGAENEKTNIEIIKAILAYLNKPESLVEYVKDRPGHDRRYAIDATKIKTELGWSPAVTFEQGIVKTLGWYYNNKEWVNHITSGDYQKYYNEMYGNR